MTLVFWGHAKPLHRRFHGCALAAIGLLAMHSSWAGDRILGTWGVSPVEGGAGGGLNPWGVISGSGSRDQNGGSVFATKMQTQGGFDLTVAGAAVGIHDRVELSMAKWSFRLSDTVPGKSIQMSVLGAKARIAGHVLYDQDTWMPQLTVGMQYKKNHSFDVPRALGASSDSGVDAYVSASKIWLGAAGGLNVLANVNVRATRANQFGLLGFGGDKHKNYQLMPELSVGVMLNDRWVAGSEWRAKPDNLSVFGEENAWDVFVAWFPRRDVNVTAAWVNMGRIADKPAQRAWYVSTQLPF